MAVLTQIGTDGIKDDAVTGAKLTNNPTIVGNLTVSGTTTANGAFTSKGIDDNADAIAITITDAEKVGIGTASPDGALHIKGTSDHGRIVMEAGGDTGSTNNMFMQFHNDGGTEIAQMEIGEGASNQGQIVFKTGGTTSAMTIDKDGDVGIDIGNIKITTAGKGIDFSATSDATGKSSELLDDYEEGTFTPDVDNITGETGANAHYTKIGRQVSFTLKITMPSTGNTSDNFAISGLPFTFQDEYACTAKVNTSFSTDLQFLITGDKLYGYHGSANLKPADLTQKVLIVTGTYFTT